MSLMDEIKKKVFQVPIQKWIFRTLWTTVFEKCKLTEAQND